MRKVVINNSSSTLQKARDTSRVYELSLANDNERITLDDDANVTIKIGNKVGYLSDVECEVKNGVILLDSVDLEEFPADKYRLEVWIEKSGRKYIYPDEDQIFLTLTDNLMDVQSNLLNVITIEQIKKEIAESGGTGERGPAGKDGQNGHDGKDGKSAYQIWLNQGHTGTEQDFLSLIPNSKEAVRHALTGWTLDRTTVPWTIWFDNGSGLQLPEYATTETVYGYGYPINLNSTDFVMWPLIPNVIAASRGTITVNKFKSKSGEFDYWSPTTKVINPLQDASKFDWSNAFGDEGTNAGPYGRKPVFARVMFELGIWSETDVLNLGATRKEV